VAGTAPPFGATAGGGCLPAPTVPGVTEGTSRPGTVAPSVGVLRAALLLVHASDTPPDDGPVARGTFDAAAEWFRTVSYGRLDFRVEATPWLLLPGPSSAYVTEAGAGRYLRDAVAAADPFVDFSEVDVVYIAPAARTPVTSPTSAILNGFGVRADGTEIRFWVPFQAGFATEEGAPVNLVHETGHLLGLPDLYASGAISTFHRWDVMAARWPSELLAWHRWKLGWIDEGAVVCLTGRTTRTVTLAPLERPDGTKAIFVKRGRRVLAVEVRARQGYDRTLCETGVLVYTVDQTPFRRRPVQIHPGQFDSDPPTGDCGGKWNAPLDVARNERRSLTLDHARIDVLAKLADGSYRVRIRAS
jgi:M6 family metalloprotease-like protein